MVELAGARAVHAPGELLPAASRAPRQRGIGQSRLPRWRVLSGLIRPGEGAIAAEKKGLFENFLGFILVVVVVVIFFIPGLLMGLINRINFVL